MRNQREDLRRPNGPPQGAGEMVEAAAVIAVFIAIVFVFNWIA